MVTHSCETERVTFIRLTIQGPAGPVSCRALVLESPLVR